MKEKTKKFKSVLNVLGIALNVLLALILVLNCYTIIARLITKKSSVSVFGISWAVVLTDSMNGDEPDSFAANSLIFTVKAKEYSVGDIITFESGSNTVTHRIVGIDDDGFITQGDANNAPDTKRVKEDIIIGKVFLTVPGIGVAIRGLMTPLGSMLLIIVCFLIIGAPMIFKRSDIEEAEKEPTTSNTDTENKEKENKKNGN